MEHRKPEDMVRSVFRLAYQVAKDDLAYGVYNVEDATGHSVDIKTCRQLISYIEYLEEEEQKALKYRDSLQAIRDLWIRGSGDSRKDFQTAVKIAGLTLDLNEDM